MNGKPLLARPGLPRVGERSRALVGPAVGQTLAAARAGTAAALTARVVAGRVYDAFAGELARGGVAGDTFCTFHGRGPSASALRRRHGLA